MKISWLFCIPLGWMMMGSAGWAQDNPAVSQAGVELKEPSGFENDATLSWRAGAGRAVSIKAPQLTLIIPGDNTRLPFKVKLRKHSLQKGEDVLEYGLSLSQGGRTITGSGTLKVSQSAKSPEDVLLVHRGRSIFR